MGEHRALGNIVREFSEGTAIFPRLGSGQMDSLRNFLECNGYHISLETLPPDLPEILRLNTLDDDLTCLRGQAGVAIMEELKFVVFATKCSGIHGMIHAALDVLGYAIFYDLPDGQIYLKNLNRRIWRGYVMRYKTEGDHDNLERINTLFQEFGSPDDIPMVPAGLFRSLFSMLINC